MFPPVGTEICLSVILAYVEKTQLIRAKVPILRFREKCRYGLNYHWCCFFFKLILIKLELPLRIIFLHMTAIWSLISTLTTRWESGTPFFWEVTPTVGALNSSPSAISSTSVWTLVSIKQRFTCFNQLISGWDPWSLWWRNGRATVESMTPAKGRWAATRWCWWCCTTSRVSTHTQTQGHVFFFSLHFYRICYFKFLDSSQGSCSSISSNWLPSKSALNNQPQLTKCPYGSNQPCVLISRSALIPYSTLTQFQKDPKISRPTIPETSHLWESCCSAFSSTTPQVSGICHHRGSPATLEFQASPARFFSLPSFHFSSCSGELPAPSPHFAFLSSFCPASFSGFVFVAKWREQVAPSASHCTAVTQHDVGVLTVAHLDMPRL